jgi:hypothetical protein
MRASPRKQKLPVKSASGQDLEGSWLGDSAGHENRFKRSLAVIVLLGLLT